MAEKNQDMFNILSHLGHANQNYIEISAYNYPNGQVQKQLHQKQQL